MLDECPGLRHEQAISRRDITGCSAWDALRRLVEQASAPGTAAIAHAATVAERLATLDQPPASLGRVPCPLVLGAAGMVIGLVGAGIEGWLADAHLLVPLAGRCPLL